MSFHHSEADLRDGSAWTHWNEKRPRLFEGLEEMRSSRLVIGRLHFEMRRNQPEPAFGG